MSLSTAALPAVAEGVDHSITEMRGEGRYAAVESDPVELQRVLCEALASLARDGQPEVTRLEAVFALERRAQSLSALLLTQYVEGDGQVVGSFEWKAWHSALRLSQGFVEAYEYLLPHVRETSGDTWAAQGLSLLVQMFHHRKIEFLLRFVRYKKRNLEHWRQLHEMYRLARDHGVRMRGNASSDAEETRRMMVKLEQQYLQILLLEAMNNGRFSPREALWAHRWFAHWCIGPGLRLAQVRGRAHFEPKGFVVDLDGSDGLMRAPVAGGEAAGDNVLYFDSSSLSVMIDQEIATLQSGAALAERTPTAVRFGQLALLKKLAIVFAPNPVDIKRRAEREPVAIAAQAIAGFPHIVEALLKNSPTSSAAGAGAPSLSIANPFEGIAKIWQVKDRSDCGCRMRCQIDNLDSVIPGSLIAVRDSETSPWIVSVVRWFRRLMVDHVEIGVEYLGCEPRLVKMASDGDRVLSVGGAPDLASRCFAALYLPPSRKYPNMPIKTLLLPAREFRTDCDVILLSSNAIYRTRLSEPIQKQFEYVLTSFLIVDEAAPLPSSFQ
jgi:hypothetical protein